jgi:hypothetical protein
MAKRGPKVLFAVRWALFAGLSVVGRVGAQALPDVDKCLTRLDPQVDIGYDRIAARCPEIARQLEQGPWSGWLPRGWKEAGNDLSAGGLTELRESIRRESAAAPPTHPPDVRHLKKVLTAQGIGVNSESWWGRFKSWLRSVLETREQPADESWFSRMVSHVGLSQSVIDLIVYATLAVVVVLAGVIVANELRNAGLLPRRGAAAGRPGRAPASVEPNGQWRDLENAPLGERPRLLLSLIVRRLGELGFLPPAGALTVRELTRAARLSESDDRARLTDLALAAERLRYSAQDVAADSLREALVRGKELLDRLDSSVSR